MLKFKINNYITLRLEDGITNIYVNDELFNHCKYILTRPNINELEFLNEIQSVDELAELLDNSLDGIGPEFIDIPSETQFWVHCSNMQVWAENNYDSRLLHSNLAFPLLKKLTEVGDSIAKKVFKEEIAKRLESCFIPTIWYLISEDFMRYFLDEELKLLLEKIYEKNKKVYDFVIIFLLFKNNLNYKIFDKNIMSTLEEFKNKIESGSYDDLYLGDAVARRLRLITDDIKRRFYTKNH